MAVKNITFFFAFVALLAVTFANTATDDSSNALAIEPTERLAALKYKYYPATCYRRVQTCCYKYFPCGIKCTILRCTKIRKCILRNPFTKKCLKYKLVKICIKKCYKKLCRRFRCSRFRVVKSRFYIAPKPFKLGKKVIIWKK